MLRTGGIYLRLRHSIRLHAIDPALYPPSTTRNVSTVQGWVQNIQRLGRKYFLRVSDGNSSETFQAVLPRELVQEAGSSSTESSSNSFSVSQRLTIGSSIVLYGEWQSSPGPQQTQELAVSSFSVVGHNDSVSNPIQPKSDTTPDELRQHIHLRMQHPSFAALLRLRSILTIAVRRWYQENGYIEIDAPLLSQNDCEGAGEAFSVTAKNVDRRCSLCSTEDDDKFFATDVYLPVSSQLHLEAMAGGAFPRVFAMNPAFRADRQLSRQHLAEFRMIEAEVGFIDTKEPLLDGVVSLISTCAKAIAQQSQAIDQCKAVYKSENLESSYVFWTQPNLVVPRMTFSEAVQVLKTSPSMCSTVANPISRLNKAQERFLIEHCGTAVFVTDFPSKNAPFYMKRSEDELTVENFDLLTPHCYELCGGSLRENSYERLSSRIGDLGLDAKLACIAFFFHVAVKGPSPSD